jgi:hypothetical protein
VGAYGTQAQAADLGGDCCADLEERVAELEATTARKGTRKVSLQVYGQVNEMVMFWDDGEMNDAYVVTNNVSRGRFGFRGSAKIDSDWTAGYRIEIGITTAGSDDVSQFASTISGANSRPGDDHGGSCGILSGAAFQNVTGGCLDLRHSFWYIQSKTFGTVSVGLTDTPMSGAYTVELANIPHTDAGFDDWGGSLFIRRTDGVLSTTQWTDLRNPVSATYSLVRREEVMYTSPEFAGFQFQAAWGEDDFWAVSLAYAGEFSGFRLAAKAGYSELTDAATWSCVRVGGNANDTQTEIDCTMWAVSGSIMHVPTGLFVSGGYGELTDNNRGPALDDTDSGWWIHAGIEQKFFAIGKTTLYGEYLVHQNAQAAFDEFGLIDGGDTVSSWGLGIVQSIDAAAMDIYIAYRNHSVELSPAIPREDLQVIGVGALIKF